MTYFHKKHFFSFGILFLCLTYFLFQLFLTHYSTISVDEFWFTHWIYRYKSGLPYRDFSPYKTVLGYYLLLAPVVFSKGFLTPLLNTKITLALINMLCFLLSALWLQKFFPRPAVLITTTLLITSEVILDYSTNVRVDFLAYWFCLFSALLVFEKKYFYAGILIAFGFLTSQKAIWYITATNVALIINWLAFYRNKSEARNIAFFNTSVMFTVMIYILFWSSFSNLHTVLHNMFYEAYIMYQLDWYDHARKLFWAITLFHNPLLFLLWPVTLISLFVFPKNNSEYQKRVFALSYGITILCLLIPFKQVFPYYMTAALPAFFIMYSAFFSWFFQLSTNNISIAPEKLQNTGYQLKTCWHDKIVILSILYISIFAWILFNFHLPFIYSLIAFIPIFLILFFKLKEKIFLNLIMIIMIFTGLVYPLVLFAISLPEKNGSYQKNMLQLSRNLLEDHSDYLAGIELFYDKNQPILGLRHLDGVGIDYLYFPSNKLRPAMLDSLYKTPDVTINSAIQAIQHSAIKFYVNNYRLMALPPELKNYLSSQYEHFWGSLYLYAPQIQQGRQFITLKFSNEYQIESNQSIFIDGNKFLPFEKIFLKKGMHASNANTMYRLKLIPKNITSELKNEYQADRWVKMLL